MAIRLETLGGLKVFRDDREVVTLPRQRLRCGLVIYLAVERRVARSRLAQMLWPPAELDAARKRLSTMVYELRQDLGSDWIEVQGDELMATDLLTTDAPEFVDRVEAGAVAEATAMYRGPFLGSQQFVGTTDFEDWAETQRGRLATLYRDAQVENLRELLDRGDVRSALSAARHWVLADPLDDDAQHRLMGLLHRCGLRNEALRQFEGYRQRLSSIDAEPLPSVVELAEGIKRGDVAGGVPSEIGVAVGRHFEAKAGIVVFPILNSSGDDSRQYFCDGLAEEIIHVLGRAPGLRVVPRISAFSFDKPRIRVSLAARELGVSHALESSVRFDGDRYRVRVALIDGSDETVLWQDQFEGALASTDVFKLQDQVAEAVFGALADRLELARGAPGHSAQRRARWRPPKRETADPAAYALYLRGRHAWFGRSVPDLLDARELFEEATRRDPGYARAHAGIADVYLVLGGLDYATDAPAKLYAPAIDAAEKALVCDPDLAQAHAAKGNYLMNHKWSWNDAGESLREAIEIDPGYSSARQWYSNYLMCLGRVDEAIAEATLALEIDPRSAFLASSLARHYQLMRLPERAAEQYEAALKIDPAFVSARIGLALAKLQSRAVRPCIDDLRRLLSVDPDVPLIQALLAYAHAEADEPAEARKCVERLKATAAAYLPPEYVAVAYIGLGEYERALDKLDEAFSVGSPTMTLLKQEPLFDPLRSNSRFRRLLANTGLDQAFA